MTSLCSGDGALVILPSQRVQAKVSPWRRLYDPEHWLRIPPHITVAYPFARQEEWPALRPALAGCLSTFRPFWITLAELGAFESPQAVLWLRPDDGGMVLRIHSELGQRFPSHVQTGSLPFISHLTVGFFDTGAAMAAARARMAAAKAAWQPLRFRVRAVQYAVYCEDRVWRMVDALPLGGSGTQ